jgi:hypothetical protein
MATPNEQLVGGRDGAGVVQAQKAAAGTYKDRAQWGTVASPGPQKSTVSPFKGMKG